MSPPVPKRPTKKCRIALALLVIAGGFGGLAYAVARSPSEPAAAGTELSNVVSIEMRGFRFEYHTVTGSESLFNDGADPRHLRNVLAANPEVGRACREALARKLGVVDLPSLRDPRDDTIKRLRELGYL